MADVALLAANNDTPDAEAETTPVTSEERRTSELVIALVGPVGAGVSTTAKSLSEILQKDYNYKTATIKVSDIVNERVELVGKDKIDRKDSERINKLQIAGSALREKYGEDVLANFCIEKIHDGRDVDPEQDGLVPDKVRRHCTIIDSLKNPREVSRLRTVYGEMFWLIGVFAPEDIRVSRLLSEQPDNAYIHKIKDQDYDEGKDHGQSVKDTMGLADTFIRNDAPNTIKLGEVINIFLERIFEIGVRTPNSEETAMFSAASVALKSACLSRQVGAVIQSENGEIIGQGTNDVPKFNGGLYTSDEKIEHDHRCYNWKSKLCHNDTEKDVIFDQITEIASSSFQGADPTQLLAFATGLKRSRIKGLIEFSRAVHAEMAAIVSVARDGLGKLRGSTLFSTTFPCHSCARHIVAAGIKTVYYIEPYPKSLALKLHNDSISTNESDTNQKVVFLQYQGAAPRSFSRIFQQNPVRKEKGSFLLRTKNDAMPLFAPPIDSLVSREEIELGRLFKEIKNDEGQN